MPITYYKSNPVFIILYAYYVSTIFFYYTPNLIPLLKVDYLDN